MSTCSTNKNNNRRRFRDDQVKSLETTFETESRPELRLKQHLANKLGLQPRQVAIWFQNKRARSKSKHIEHEYSMLKSDYDKLASEFEVLRKENQTLVMQVERLRNMADKRDGGAHKNENHTTSENPRGQSHDLCMPSCSNQQNKKVDYLELETDGMNMAQFVENCSLASPENGCSFESCTFLDDTGNCSQWWGF